MKEEETMMIDQGIEGIDPVIGAREREVDTGNGLTHDESFIMGIMDSGGVRVRWRSVLESLKCG